MGLIKYREKNNEIVKAIVKAQDLAKVTPITHFNMLIAKYKERTNS